MKRKILSTLLVLCMLVSLLPTTVLAATTYNDTDGHWAADAIDRWSGYGVVNGKGEGSFDPDGQMTRAEAAQVFANLLGLNKEGDISAYPDAQGEWYSEAIAKCVAAGILNGKGAGKMDPNGTITREEFLTMYARAICISNGAEATEAKSELAQKGFADTAKVSDWAADSIGTLVEKGYVNGLTATELAPQANINRASVMALLNQSISTYVGKDSTETTVAAKSEGITLIANPAVTSVTGTADVVVVAAGAEQYNETTGEIEHNDIRVESAKMPVARVQGENITVTLTVNTEAEDAEVTETAVKSEIVVESTATVNKLTVSAEGAKATVSGKVESVTVAETAKSAAVETKANSTVGTLNVAAEDAKTTVAGKVETVKVEETAKNATVDTKSTAKVETVENKAENTAVTGTGSVGSVKSSEDVKIETKNTKVENTSETKEIAVTDSKGTETKVETKTESTGATKTETTVNTQPTGGGDSHSHSYATGWTYDETDHWHAATCGHDVVSGKAAHSFDEKTHRCECGAFASGIVAAIGDQGYETLKKAFDAVKSGETVRLTSDITLAENIDFTKNVGEEYTLELNGHKIDHSGKSFNVSNCTFNIKDSVGTGSIINDSGVALSFGAHHVKSLSSCPVLNIYGGTIKGKNNGGNPPAAVGHSFAIMGDGSTDDGYVNAKIINIYGGNIEGLEAGESQCNVYGGTITSYIYSPSRDNTSTRQDGIDAIRYTLYGGSFDLQPNGFMEGIVDTFNVGAMSLDRLVIKGGTYNIDPSAYVAPGYAAKANGTDPETWTVATFFASGSGTESDPFQVATAEQFANITKASGTSSNPVYYQLTSNVDLANAKANNTNTYGFDAVVSIAKYIILDGNNHKITCKGNDIKSIFGDFNHSTLKNVKFDLSCPVSGYLNSGTFENIEVDGFMEFSNNTGVIGVYCFGATLKNVHVKADVVSNSYSAVFFGYNFGADYTLTDCTYSGSYVGPYAGLVFGNATYYRATVTITNFTLTGTVRHTNNDASAYNPLVAICSDGQWSDTTQKVLTIDGVAVSNETAGVSAIKFSGNGGYLTGPEDKGLSISVNENETFTIGESEFNNAHHYVVEIVANVINKGPYGGSINISVEETITDDGSGTYTTKLKDFGFANGDAATSKLADTWDIITIDGNDYYWESNPEYVCGTRGLNTEVFVRAYDENGMLLSSAIFSRAVK